MKSDNDGSRTAAEANRLYWNSEQSVNSIAEVMGLSKSSLYGLIDPLSSESKCPDCSAEMVYRNRTALDKEALSCPSCGLQTGNSSGTKPKPAKGDASADSPVDATEERSAGSPSSTGRPSNRVLAGAALLGVAAGIVVAAAIRKRHD